DLRRPKVQHLTFLDHIARTEGVSRPEDPQYQRASSWFSLYMPGYARTEISIDSSPGQRDLLYSWAAPGDTVHRYPNVDRYMVDVGERPAPFEMPSRATSTQLYANWLGGLDSAWGGLIRQHPDDPIR